MYCNEFERISRHNARLQVYLAVFIRFKGAITPLSHRLVRLVGQTNWLDVGYAFVMNKQYTVLELLRLLIH